MTASVSVYSPGLVAVKCVIVWLPAPDNPTWHSFSILTQKRPMDLIIFVISENSWFLKSKFNLCSDEMDFKM